MRSTVKQFMEDQVLWKLTTFHRMLCRASLRSVYSPKNSAFVSVASLDFRVFGGCLLRVVGFMKINSFQSGAFIADKTTSRKQEYEREDQNTDDVVLNRTAPV